MRQWNSRTWPITLALVLVALIFSIPQAGQAGENLPTLAEAKKLAAEDGHGRQPIIWVQDADDRRTAEAAVALLVDEGYNGNLPAIANYSQATFQDRQNYGLDVSLTDREGNRTLTQWPRVTVIRKGYRDRETGQKVEEVVSFGSFPLTGEFISTGGSATFAAAMAACKYDRKSGSYYCSSGYCSSRRGLFRGRFRRK